MFKYNISNSVIRFTNNSHMSFSIVSWFSQSFVTDIVQVSILAVSRYFEHPKFATDYPTRHSGIPAAIPLAPVKLAIFMLTSLDCQLQLNQSP